MITLFEHFEYSECGGFIDNLEQAKKDLLQEKTYRKIIKRQGEDVLCYNIVFDEEKRKHKFCTSYFVGVDWITDKLEVYIQPKLNDSKTKTEIDYLSMLFEAMQEPVNFEHLDGLFEIYFDKPQIEITQKQDILTPFLIIQYLQMLKRIVQKGLKKTYYPVVRNLESKVKGKILINQTIKTHLAKNQMTKTHCRYDEFGLNGEENRILKKALLFSQRAIYSYDLRKNYDTIINLFHYVNPALETVSDDILIEKIKCFKPNPMYKEYEQALKLALLILKRFSYNIIETENTKKLIPPFWIDMSKLFEMYVYKKLREIYPKHKEVIYHQKVNYQELDFFINSEGMKMVIDAKYKPRYKDKKIDDEDIRQVCGYARLEKIYDIFGFYKFDNCEKVYDKQNLDCLIIYPNQESSNFLNQKNLTKQREDGYVYFYRCGIKLPEISDF